MEMISILNKQGVNQLLKGDYGSSIATFRLQRAQVRAYARTISCKGRHCHHTTQLRPVEIQRPQIADNGSIFFPLVFCDVIDHDEEGSDDETLIHDEEAQNLASNRCRLCQRAVCLQSAMICYNLAMSHHIRSMRTSLHRSSDSQSAIQLYRHVMTLTRSVEPSVRDGAGYLMVSASNNLAFLLAEVCDFTGVELCIGWVLARFPIANKAIGPFLSNAVIWRMLEAQPSAAA